MQASEQSVLQFLDISLRPRNCQIEPVAMDSIGITADSFKTTIGQCILKRGHVPKLLYLVPSCSNPTGTTQTLQRKREIYAVCQQHNIVILEDDPYAFLQFPGKAVTCLVCLTLLLFVVFKPVDALLIATCRTAAEYLSREGDLVAVCGSFDRCLGVCPILRECCRAGG